MTPAEVTRGQYKLRGDTVYLITGPNCSLRVCKIYGHTAREREVTFKALTGHCEGGVHHQPSVES